MKNILTIDLEEWFQVFFGENLVDQKDWDLFPSEILSALDVIRKILDSKNLKITFFTVAWLAKKHPEVIKILKNDGHEIASHGYWHQQLFKMSQKEVKIDISISKKILEDTIGDKILGYRAPGFSVSPNMSWVFDILSDQGYEYDSSYLYSRKDYIHKLGNGLIQVPPNSLSILSKEIPTCGGFFFRLCPLSIYTAYVSRINNKKVPLIFYTHSWEIYPSKNRLRLPLIKYFIQYYNLNSVQKKFIKLADNFEFLSIRDYINLNGTEIY